MSDFTRFKKVVYISNCEEDQNLPLQDSICSRNNLNDIGGRIDLIPINVGTQEFNINVDELKCIIEDDTRIFDYNYVRDLNSNQQFQDIQREVCESPTESPTSGPSQDPTPTPTDNPTTAPTEGPSPYPSRDPTLTPTDDPSLSPTHAPNYEAKCVYKESTDVIFIVDESCNISSDDIKHQNEFIANMAQRIKYGATEPRLGYIASTKYSKYINDR